MEDAQTTLASMAAQFEEVKASNDPVKIAQMAATFSSVIKLLVGTMKPNSC